MTRRRHKSVGSTTHCEGPLPAGAKNASRYFFSAFYFFLELTVANAAGVRNFDIPAEGVGPGSGCSFGHLVRRPREKWMHVVPFSLQSPDAR